jgi:energy-coupling factor transporter ATP-binding protein EcfA2
MASRVYSAFIAYPGSPADLAGPITAAANSLSGKHSGIQAWPALDIFGANIPHEIKAAIEQADIVFADVTRSNMNVYFETGYAIGLGKTFAPIVNTSFANSTSSLRGLGLFSNIGYQAYENYQQLSTIIMSTPSNSLLELYAQDINYSQPLFLVDTLRKTDFRNAVVSSIKGSRSHYRSFDPLETARISVVQLLTEVSSSSGIIIPYLASHIDDAERHNTRGALIAGLAMGLGRDVLIITDQQSDTAPADYNDNIVVAVDQASIASKVDSFCSEAVLSAQEIPAIIPAANRSILQNLSLGSSAAENEFRDLNTYFVETSEYLRASRGEVNVITGRKGSGKSAIFFQVRDHARRKKGSLTVDLKPESHQLSTFRDQIISTAGAGVFEHTIAAFWYFVCLSEMLLTVYRRIEATSKYDGRFLEPMRHIEDLFSEYNILEPGDFTTRLTRLSTIIARELRDATRNGKTISVNQVTNMVFKSGIGKIRELIISNTNPKYPITFLFDNIDKGWPATGVQREDVTIVRLLVESLDKVRSDLSAKGREFHSLVFVRHDVYDLMMDQTSDRGKSGQVSIDWTDRAKLTQVIFRRLQVGLGDKRSSMAELWHRIFPRTVLQRESLNYFIDHSLMRPRFLIDLIEGAIANGINRGRRTIEEADCIDAVRQHSLTLVDDFGFEMRDVSGISSDVLYGLLGASKSEHKSVIGDRFIKGGFTEETADMAIRLMFWYGLIGIEEEDGRGKYIYDYLYNMKRLTAEAAQRGENPLLVINPALHVGLVS